MKELIKRKFSEIKTIDNNVIRSITILALPLLIRAILQSLQSVIDMFWVGKLGASSIAAVSMGGTVIMAILPILFGISTGTVALIARNIGSHNYHKANKVAAQSISVALFTSLLFVILGISFSQPILRLLQAKGEVLFLGDIYLKILLYGGITMTLLFLGGAILQGAGDTIIPMYIMGIVTVINICLDPVLIFGFLGFPKMGVSGAAYATILAQAIGAVLILFIIFKGKSNIHVLLKEIKVDFPVIWQIVKIGIPSSIQLFFTNIMNMVLISISAGFGTYVIAAYGIGMRLRMLILLPAFALGQASATLVGQNLGAKNKKSAEHCARLATMFDAAIMTVFTVIFFVFSKQIISIFNNNQEIIKEGSLFLKITAPFFPFVALSVVFSRSLQGAGETIPPMIISFAALLGVQIPLAMMLSKISYFGPSGIWWAVSFSSLLNGLITLWWFNTGRWKNKKLLPHEFLED